MPRVATGSRVRVACHVSSAEGRTDRDIFFLRVSAWESTLIAERSPVLRRRASQTVPKPPWPIGSTSTYALIEREALCGFCVAGGAHGSCSVAERESRSRWEDAVEGGGQGEIRVIEGRRRGRSRRDHTPAGRGGPSKPTFCSRRGVEPASPAR